MPSLCFAFSVFSKVCYITGQLDSYLRVITVFYQAYPVNLVRSDRCSGVWKYICSRNEKSTLNFQHHASRNAQWITPDERACDLSKKKD